MSHWRAGLRGNNFSRSPAELTVAQMAKADPRAMVALNPLVDARSPEEQKTLRIL